MSSSKKKSGISKNIADAPEASGAAAGAANAVAGVTLNKNCFVMLRDYKKMSSSKKKSGNSKNIANAAAGVTLNKNCFVMLRDCKDMLSSKKKSGNSKNIANAPEASSAAAGPSSAAAGPSSAAAGVTLNASCFNMLRDYKNMSSLKRKIGYSENIANALEASSAAAGALNAAASAFNAAASAFFAAAGITLNPNFLNVLRDFPIRIQSLPAEMFNDPAIRALVRKTDRREVPSPNSPACVITLENNIRILSVPSTRTQVVLLEPLASLTLHGYVKVTVCLGSIHILGYEVEEGQTIKVFSTEGTGLKKIVALNSVHQSTIDVLKPKLNKILYKENIDIKEFLNSIQPNTVVIIVAKAPLSAPLRVLELYHPKALQAKLPSDTKIKREEKFKLCSTEESYAIDISEDFKKLSEEINQMISRPVSDGESGPRILVIGEKKVGKSTLIRYLMNSALNKHSEIYFLDTDLDQAECTPPGVVTLFRVTNPWLGPPFLQEQELIQMVFVGSVSPATFPELFERSVISLVTYFNDYLRKKTLFVNTTGWGPGILDVCLQGVRLAVKPTAVIKLVPPYCHLSFKKDAAEVTNFIVPSKCPSRESDVSSFSDMEMRNFKILAYLGQCQRPFVRLTPINSLEVFRMNLNGIGLHIMGQVLPLDNLVKTIPCSLVALCHVDESCLMRNNKPGLPKRLCDDLVHECFGFAFVKETDEAKKFFEIITPVDRKKLIHVNALITGQIALPAAIFIKQEVHNSVNTTTLPVRSYLDYFQPLINEGLLKIIYLRPDDPVQSLADWFLNFKDIYYEKMMDGVVYL